MHTLRMSELPEFHGEHKKDDIYTVENTRPIDVIMELFTMLKADKMYGQPGTDGSFWSNVMEMVKNDNDFISIFMLNKGHPFNKVERFKYFGLCVFLNMLINSNMGKVKGIDKNLVSLIVSCALIVVKKVIRLAYEAPCLSRNAAASDLRDSDKTPDEIVKENQEREKSIQEPINTVITFLILGTGAASVASAYSNFEIAQYILTLAFNVVIFALAFLIINVLMGAYGRDREEFEKKWGALKYNGEFLHPKSISDVAAFVVRVHGGREEALKHLDQGSRDNYYAYFCLEGEGDLDLFSQGTINSMRRLFSCCITDEKMVAKYEARFDGNKRLNPYNIETKSALYGNVIKDFEMPPGSKL